MNVMGVYVKGMKMPKDDVRAFKRITITNNWVDGEVIMLAHDTITNEFIGEVVEVPEPHGRLIDVDGLINDAIEAEKDGITFCIDSAEELEIFFDDDAPIVIEAEE